MNTLNIGLAIGLLITSFGCKTEHPSSSLRADPPAAGATAPNLLALANCTLTSDPGTSIAISQSVTDNSAAASWATITKDDSSLYSGEVASNDTSPALGGHIQLQNAAITCPL